MNPNQQELKCSNCEATFDTQEELEEHEKECVGEQAMEEELGEAEQEQEQEEEEEGFSEQPNRQRQQKP